MNRRDEKIDKLDGLVSRTRRFISDILIPRNDVNKQDLSEALDVLTDYNHKGDMGILTKIRKIESKPTREGAATDYTFGMSLQLDGEYLSLRDLALEIEDLVFEIQKGEL